MKYEFLSLAESGNGSDFIMAVRRQPNFWERLAGGQSEIVEFFGPRPLWFGMEGLPAPPPIERTLERFWQSHPHQCQHPGAAAWEEVEPAASPRETPGGRHPAQGTGSCPKMSPKN